MSQDRRLGTTAEALQRACWRTSSFSGAVGNCVEVAALDTGEVAVRHSRHPARPALVFSAGAWSSFVTGVDHDELRPTDGGTARR